MQKIIMMLLLFSASVLHCNEYCILRSRGDGMFSVFGDVLCMCRAYDEGDLYGMEVDFQDQGLYYDPEMGLNWFEYFCEPIRLGEKIHPVEHYGYLRRKNGIENVITKEEANRLIRKYIRIRKEILDEVQDFFDIHLSGCHVISVHYRGTDKILEAPRTGYNAMIVAIENYIAMNEITNPKIFLATDEQEFLNVMKEKFLDILAYNNVERSESEEALHFSCKNSIENGRGAIIDCLLLSKGDVLIKTSSNLSLWSIFFNPDMPVIELSKRYSLEERNRLFKIKNN